MTSRMAMKLKSFVQLNEAELQCLEDLHVFRESKAAQGKELVSQGDDGRLAYILQSGWGCSYKTLQDGSRQIITFPVPGDCIGLRSVLLRTSDHTFSALTDITVSTVSIPRMLQLFNEFPHLGAAILWATSRDEAITVEHLASVGRRSAIERTAHFFLELYDRLELVGLAANSEFNCPLTQYDLADALGLSAIHVNRVLRELRVMHLMTFNAHTVRIESRQGLKELAGYEDVEESAVLVRSS